MDTPIYRFKRPNTFLVPNYIFDELLADLSGAETKVLFYLYRWTVNGPPVTQQRIAEKTYQDKRTVMKALKSLDARGEIRADYAGDQYCIPMEDNTPS